MVSFITITEDKEAPSQLNNKTMADTDDVQSADDANVSGISQDEEDSSWAKLQISPNNIGSMEYGQYFLTRNISSSTFTLIRPINEINLRSAHRQQLQRIRNIITLPFHCWTMIVHRVSSTTSRKKLKWNFASNCWTTTQSPKSPIGSRIITLNKWTVSSLKWFHLIRLRWHQHQRLKNFGVFINCLRGCLTESKKIWDSKSIAWIKTIATN